MAKITVFGLRYLFLFGLIFAVLLVSACSMLQSDSAVRRERPPVLVTGAGGCDLPTLIRQVRPAVVNVRGGNRSRGTGFIIHPLGWVITNQHVIKGVKNPEVILLGDHIIKVEIVAQNKDMDVALLKLNVNRSLPFLELDDASRPIVGEWVLALGNPFGLEVSATVGIISATEVVLGSSPLHWIQIDASVNPGNSGGPLINMRGKVAGVVSSRTTMGQGLGFAVPVPEIKKFITPFLVQD